jgi:hypothetical protein
MFPFTQIVVKMYFSQKQNILNHLIHHQILIEDRCTDWVIKYMTQVENELFPTASSKTIKFSLTWIWTQSNKNKTKWTMMTMTTN